MASSGVGTSNSRRLWPPLGLGRLIVGRSSLLLVDQLGLLEGLQAALDKEECVKVKSP